MKLPWNKKYLVISFHIIVTLLVVYSLKYCIDFLAYVASNLGLILNNIKGGIGWLLSIFSVVVIAFIISYLLEPIVEFFQNRYDLFKVKYFQDKSNKSFLKTRKKDKEIDEVKYKSRMQGVLITYLMILGIIIILTVILFVKITKSGSGNNILESITTTIKTSVTGFVNDFSNIYAKIENFLINGGVFDYISPHINKFVNALTNFIGGIGNGIVSIISSIGNWTVNILISFVIAFYFLKDKYAIKSKFENIASTFLHKKIYSFTKNALGDIHAVFSGYIRGTLLDASIMAILISIALSLINVKFAVIIGIISGFSNIIPYFGALMGFILAISVSLISGQPMQALYSTIIMFALQQVDTIFIAPRVIGESVELSPVLVIIALSIAGQMFGLWGMVFAVPVFATIKLFATRIYERQKAKKNAKILLEQ